MLLTSLNSTIRQDFLVSKSVPSGRLVTPEKRHATTSSTPPETNNQAEFTLSQFDQQLKQQILGVKLLYLEQLFHLQARLNALHMLYNFHVPQNTRICKKTRACRIENINSPINDLELAKRPVKQTSEKNHILNWF